MIFGDFPLSHAADPCANRLTTIAATVAVRFGYVNVLEYFLSQHHSLFPSLFSNDGEWIRMGDMVSSVGLW
jgi:hypothetical protein